MNPVRNGSDVHALDVEQARDPRVVLCLFLCPVALAPDLINNKLHDKKAEVYRDRHDHEGPYTGRKDTADHCKNVGDDITLKILSKGVEKTVYLKLATAPDGQ